MVLPTEQFAADLDRAFRLELEWRGMTRAQYLRLSSEHQNGFLVSAMDRHMPAIMAARAGCSEAEVREAVQRIKGAL